ncbi:MAG: PIN domain-containing protein [Bryobacteraceae bacterium]
MTRFLLDTTFIIDVLNGRRTRPTVMRDLIANQHELGCCPINVTEIYTGLRPAEKEKTDALLRSFELFPISFEAGRLAGELLQAGKAQGKTFSVPDMIIAAVCITEDLTLITDNRKDFTMPDLKLHPLR